MNLPMTRAAIFGGDQHITNVTTTVGAKTAETNNTIRTIGTKAYNAIVALLALALATAVKALANFQKVAYDDTIDPTEKAYLADKAKQVALTEFDLEALKTDGGIDERVIALLQSTSYGDALQQNGIGVASDDETFDLLEIDEQIVVAMHLQTAYYAVEAIVKIATGFTKDQAEIDAMVAEIFSRAMLNGVTWALSNEDGYTAPDAQA